MTTPADSSMDRVSTWLRIICGAEEPAAKQKPEAASGGAIADIPVPAASKDNQRDYIQRMAAACLDHVRKVKWGAGISSYQGDDGELEIHVTIKVECYAKAQKKDAK